MKTLATYKNGNCDVTLFEDGSLTRTWEGEAKPEHPCSIDIHITGYCEAGCPFCHEQSTTKGKPADYHKVCKVLDGLPPGVELAIGGGNPFSHPSLVYILEDIKDRGLIANMTINSYHLHDYTPTVIGLRSMGLLKGLGISYSFGYEEHIAKVLDDNTVIHAIAGVDDFFEIARNKFKKVLVLGYKNFGRGVHYQTAFPYKVKTGLDVWKYWLHTLSKHSLVSFDNLAIKQLDVENKVIPEYWKEHYMGDDGKFTMYYDAVADQYAVSSTSPRIPMNGMTLAEAFKKLQQPIA